MVTMPSISTVAMNAKTGFVMTLVQVLLTGVAILYKLAANDGMSITVMVAYRFMLATAVMFPLALVIERNNRPQLTRKVIALAFLSGLFGGSMAQNLYVKSIALTSATYVTAMANLIPGLTGLFFTLTFILGIVFRLEKLNLGTKPGKAKLAGTLLGMSGAMLLTFYKGVEIDFWSTHLNLLTMVSSHSHQASHVAHNWLLGTLLAVGSCLSLAMWLIVQEKLSQAYPVPYSSTALMSSMGAVQGTVYALCVEKDWSQWKIGADIRLLTVLYLGIVASGGTITMITWCVHLKGPLYVSVFNPLLLVFVAMAGLLVLDEQLHLGSLLGAGVIVIGLYLVLWGKAKEVPATANTREEGAGAA